MNSPLVSIAATAAALFVVLLVMTTYVLPYLAQVNGAFAGHPPVTRKPQTQGVLDLLREFGEGGVTPSEARDIVGTDRLAARIAELRAEGFDIETSRWTTPRTLKHVARYILHEAVQLSFDTQRDGSVRVSPPSRTPGRLSDGRRAVTASPGAG